MAAVHRKARWGRWLLIVVFGLLAVAYTITWFVMKPMIEEFADDWVEQQRAVGVEIEYSERHVEGFPLNFELVFEDPIAVSPDGDVRFAGDQIRLESRTWDFVAMLANQWGRVEAKLPGKSQITGDALGTDTVSLDVDAATRVLVEWTGESGVQSAQIKLSDVTGTAATEPFEIYGFVIDLLPSEILDDMYDLELKWDKLILPEHRVAEMRAAAESPQYDSMPFRGTVIEVLESLENGTDYKMQRMMNVVGTDASGNLTSPLLGAFN